MLLEKIKKISEISEFSILPYTQNPKLVNLGKCSFTSNFDGSWNLRFRNNKNKLRQKLAVIKWIKKNKRKFPRFPSFRFCSIPKIENSEISESVLLLQIMTVIVIKIQKRQKWTEAKAEWSLIFLCLLILFHIFPENFIEVPHVVQKMVRFSRSILIFHQFLGFSDISLLTRKEIVVTK